MRIRLYEKEHLTHHAEWIRPFAAGLQAQGDEVEFNAHGDADLHVFWSMKHAQIIKHCADTRQPFLCLERGYIDRMNFASVNLNGLNGLSKLNLDSLRDNDSRRNQYGWHARPWRDKGCKVYIMGQVPGDASLGGTDIHKWAKGVWDWYDNRGVKAYFKPHPLSQADPYFYFPRHAVFTGDIDEVWNQADHVVTYSSNAAVDAWINGVRAYGESPMSMINRWVTPGGECLGLRHWLNDLSFRQWSKKEFESGEAWKILRPLIQA